MRLPRDIRTEIVELLIPLTGSQDERRALVESAFAGTSLEAQINYNGSAKTFSEHLVSQVQHYGTIDNYPSVLLLLDGIAQLRGGDYRQTIEQLKRKIEQLPPEAPKPSVMGPWLPLLIGLGLVAAVYVASLLMPPAPTSPNGGVSIENSDITGSTIVGGDLINTNVESIVGTLSINTGDSPEEIERKQRATANYFEALFVENLTSADGILGQVRNLRAVRADDPASDALATVRPPAVQEAFEASYETLLRDADLAQLRANLNSYELHQVPAGVQPVLPNVQLDANTLRWVNQQVESVEWALDQWLDALDTEPQTSPAWETWYEQHLTLAEQRVENQIDILHLYLLMGLHDLKNQYPEEIMLPGDNFVNLPPVPEADIPARLDDALAEAEAIQEKNERLTETGAALLEEDVGDYADVIADLQIQPGDSWDTVAGKAVSLRQLGYTEDAIDAFATYSEMFADGDPTAERYAATAQAFTRQMDALGVVDGAVYVYVIEPDSPADESGLQAGDIIIALNEHEIRNTCDMAFNLPSPVPDVCHQLEPEREKPDIGDRLTVTVLRLQDDGTFTRETLTVNREGAETIGISYMPI